MASDGHDKIELKGYAYVKERLCNTTDDDNDLGPLLLALCIVFVFGVIAVAAYVRHYH